MSPEQRHQFGRAALPLAVVGAVLLAGMAGLVWVKQAKASSAATSATSSAPALAAGGAPESSAALTKRYAESCELAVRERRFDNALELCNEFTQSQELAGRAHASMAVASMLRSDGISGTDSADFALSARHAEAAAKLNDALGKMIWAYHGLNGHGATPVAPEQAQALLTEAQTGGVAKAELLLASLGQSKDCRERAQVALFELPIFCMGRGELRGALKALGMREQEQSAGTEREVFALGQMLPGAKQMSLQYAKQPASQLLAPVHVSYRFGMQEAAFAHQTLQRLQDNLRKKYGQPLRSDGDSLGQWRSSDGVLIELRRDGAGDLLLSYRHEQRTVTQREQMLALEARRVERLNSLTLKAL